MLTIPKDKPQYATNPTSLDLPQPQFSLRDTLRLGRVGVLTPWGVVTFGGRSGVAHYMDPPVLYRVSASLCSVVRLRLLSRVLPSIRARL